MRRHDETRLETAIQALRADAPDPVEISGAAARVAGRLGIEGMNHSMTSVIDNCEDVQGLLASYLAGNLAAGRSLLVEAHLRDCGACLRQYRSGNGSARLDWSAPKATRAFVWRPKVLGWALAPCLALAAISFFVYRAYWQVPPGVRAQVESIDGSAYLISDAGDRRLAPGDSLSEGERLRTNGGAHTVLRLADGSTVEVNERSVLEIGARGHSITVSLDNGAVIVQAAKRTSGHLYVKTPDCRVAVTGTLFSVNSGIKGSRVAVLQGSVQVMHAGVDSVIKAGDQLATYDNSSPAPANEQIAQQISWSHDRDKYLPLLAQFAMLERRIGDIPFPQPRYTSDLLARVPADTLLYISIPNLGDFMSEANSIFHDQLKQSPALQQWWAHDGGNNTAELDSLVDKLHDMSRYLGDEVVVVGLKQSVPGNHPSFAIVADVQKSGLDDFLKTQFVSSGSAHGITVFNEQSLTSASVPSKEENGGYALIRQHEAVFSNSIATLRQLVAQLNAGASGFATGEFGKQITAAYGRGAGVILAADIHSMFGSGMELQRSNRMRAGAIAESGMDSVRYLIAEHRETNGLPENHLNLQFSGTRQRVASWLAAPAPIGSLDFVTPNAAVAVAGLSKDPKAIADDIMAMTATGNGAGNKDWSEAEAKLHISIRDDLAANLGGDFLMALDGPVLPTPSWKAVIEVHDSERLEQTLEQLLQSIRNETQNEKNRHDIAIEPSQVGSQRFYSIKDVSSGASVAEYAFADGFMIIAPTRALILEALRTHSSGNSLARSAAFKALLPKDENENYSAVAYQNLSPVLTPLLSQLSGESAEAIKKLAADARPTTICAWGKDSRIEVASDSRLFGFDFLTLGTLLNSRNKVADQNVRE